MNTNARDLEKNERVLELDVIQTLKKASITSKDVVCDYGSGTGLFSIEAAKMTRNTVYAMDMNTEFLAIIDKKAKKEKLTNIEIVQINADQIKCLNHSIDLFLMITVLHEIDNIPMFISKIKNALKSNGKVMVVDFKRENTPMGPPVHKRVSAYETFRYFVREDIVLSKEFNLGENLYMLLLENK